MYCSKCGKQIDYDAPICLECTAMIAMQSREEKKQDDITLPTVNPAPIRPTEQETPKTEEAPKPSRGKRTAGLVKAILANVSPYAGYFIFIFALSFTFSTAIESVGVLGIGFVLFIASCVVGVIFGIQSIKRFTRARKLGDPAPIPTLILGIYALVMILLLVIYGYVFAFLFAMLGEIELDYNIFDYNEFGL